MADRGSQGKKYHGVIVPAVTPLTQQGEFDEPALRRIIDYLVTGGVDGIFVLGTTGEGPSAPFDLRLRMVRSTLEYVNNRIPVYAGVASTVIDETVEAARDSLKHGAAAVVAPLPSYYLLTPDEQFHYFATLFERIRGPVMLYDIPPAVHMTIDPGVIEHLRVFPNLVGIKDSSGDPERLSALLNAYRDDPDFSILVGTTALASFGMQKGADGFIPSAGNLNPALCARMYASARKGDWALLDDLQHEIDTLQAEFAGDTIGQSIARLKRIMQKRGLCGPKLFMPLQEEE